MESVLIILDLDKEMRVEMKISDFAMGGVLSLKYKNKKQRPVAYISKLLNEAKRNYIIHDKKYWQLLDIQKYIGISQKELRVSSKFG